MPKGPQGQKRPADVVGNAVMIAKSATGEENESGFKQPAKVKSGKAGGASRAKAMTQEERVRIARIAARNRWSE